eukprot:2941331-Pleurochrysis_carterae.AAC.1
MRGELLHVPLRRKSCAVVVILWMHASNTQAVSRDMFDAPELARPASAAAAEQVRSSATSPGEERAASRSGGEGGKGGGGILQRSWMADVRCSWNLGEG